ncbi:MAG TPA: HNH endonuclease signature motif containing protein [Acidimicrobiales bacterium]|nr:HNH endonuclease signature motif containing protein [Acidimicrobiales bacterium]
MAAKWATTALALRLVLSDTGPSQFRTPEGAVVADLDRGRTARLANRAQRRALAIRDRHCAFPGCDRRAAWTDAHHVIWWRRQGHTDMKNLALLCRFHHRAVHAGRYDLTMAAAQAPVFTHVTTGERVIPRRQRPPPPS